MVGPLIDPDLHVVLWTGRDGDPPGDPHGQDIDPRPDAVPVGFVVCATQELLAGARRRTAHAPARRTPSTLEEILT